MVQRVLLIRPESDTRITNLPLGLMYIASYIRSEAVRVYILDLKLKSKTEEELEKYLLRVRPNLIGIGCLSADYKYAQKIIPLIKRCLPAALLVLGGPHVTSYPEIVLGDKNVDIAIIGEGEHTMLDIINGKALDDIAGIAYRKGRQVIRTPARPFIENLDELPYPAYDIIDMEEYFRSPYAQGFVLASKRRAQIFSSRGCPFNCVFCHSIFGKRFRKRSPKNILGEIKLLYYKYGVREIHFNDDSFNIDLKRAKEIMDMIYYSGIKIKISFPNGIRGDFLDDELLRKMKRAGVYHFCLGIESYDPGIQKNIGKALDLRKINRAITGARKYNIIAGGFLMLGFLGETKEQMLRTIDSAARSGLHTAVFAKVIPFHGTRLFDEATKAGFKIEEDYENVDYSFTRVNLSGLSEEEFNRLHRLAYFRFYSNPKRLWSLFQLFPDKVALVRHAIRLVFWHN